MNNGRKTSPDDYVRLLNIQIGSEIMERRTRLGLSAYTLGKAAGVSDQTILNLERAASSNGCWTATLARIAVRLGITMSEIVTAAEQRQ